MGLLKGAKDMVEETVKTLNPLAGERQDRVDENGAAGVDADVVDADEVRVQRTEEELHTGTAEVEQGAVEVHKTVGTDTERVAVPTRHEEVTVERHPVDAPTDASAIGSEEIRVPIVEEETVVEKRPVVKEEIVISKDVHSDVDVVETELRKEQVEIEDTTAAK
jgi:uncharacterized protein (TIGR02271 family)